MENEGHMAPKEIPSNQLLPLVPPPCRVGSNTLPPASPATREMGSDIPGETMFLVGAYARYNWPYVWVSATIPTLCFRAALPLSYCSRRPCPPSWPRRQLKPCGWISVPP